MNDHAHIQVYKKFYQRAKNLRKEFVDNFENPRDVSAGRFVWDYWYQEDQYHLVRTPAVHYFSKKLYADFHSTLVQWGRENLGCHDISPPWLSYYVDGCFQNLHSDVPHGPWAFVYSLTDSRTPHFRGGETLILKPQTLNYWSSFGEQTDHEYANFVDRVPSRFNDLIVFDPRYPHGVTEVKGTRDPLKARLVMHGWFVNPRPYVVGGLSTGQAQGALNVQFNLLNGVLETLGRLNGTLALRLSVSPAGAIESCRLVSNTVLSLDNSIQDERLFKREILKLFKHTKFPKSRSKSSITIPMLFK